MTYDRYVEGWDKKHPICIQSSVSTVVLVVWSKILCPSSVSSIILVLCSKLYSVEQRCFKMFGVCKVHVRCFVSAQCPHTTGWSWLPSVHNSVPALQWPAQSQSDHSGQEVWDAYHFTSTPHSYMNGHVAVCWKYVVQGCRFSVIFGFFRYFLPDLKNTCVLLFSIFSYFIFLSLNFLSLFVFIFCETARTRRFSVIFTKVQWHPWLFLNSRHWKISIR